MSLVCNVTGNIGMSNYIVIRVKPNGKVQRCSDDGCKLFASYEEADEIRKALSVYFTEIAYYVLEVPNPDPFEGL